MAQIHAPGKVCYPLLLRANQTCLNNWFRQLECDNCPMEIQRLMGSGTLFIMEVQQNSLKAHNITENCLMYGSPCVPWLSHFRNWGVRWKPLDYKLVPSTCSFLLSQCDLLSVPHWKGKHEKIMDSFWQRQYTLIFYYFYFASSHWKVQELSSVANLWMANG